MDRGAWQVTVDEVAKSQTQLSNQSSNNNMYWIINKHKEELKRAPAPLLPPVWDSECQGPKIPHAMQLSQK